MSAFLKLNREILSRRNLAVMQEVMQSGRVGLLQKQEVELALLRFQLAKTELEREQALLKEAEGLVRESHLQADLDNSHFERGEGIDLQEYLVDELKKVKVNIKEVICTYWELIDDCIDVGYETKENARGQKRKLPAAEQLKKMQKVVNEHNSKRARMVATAMTAASGSSTD